ncbi:DUF2330 domain-containing protein [Sorangium sp. So ce1078]|uniref:DUF2330 domain-containing protein n=1 Tax=Sorangium sp. So ce1078 TaxID=3133329 RepID=UPI003F644634
MLLAIRPRMPRRSLALVVPAVLLSSSGDAVAAGAWLPGAGQASVEQRVAVAAGPERTTLWTSLRFDGARGPVAVVVPVPPLAALDVSSDAWFEALEAATAPRVLPPEGVAPYCPGEEGQPGPFDTVGQLAHEATLEPLEVTVLEDAGAVARWAESAGLALSSETAAQLGALQGMRFAAARFDAPGGPAITRTLRVALGGGEARLPLSLATAGEGDVRVTAWLLGDGRGALTGTAPVTLPPASLSWDAGAQRSDYEELRAEALGQAGLHGALVEGASHEALSRRTAIGSDSVDSVVAAYFARASAYGDAGDGPGACAAVAAAALESSLAVAASCPRAALGVVDGSLDCAESPRRDETDPDLLRCGPVADDLAVGLSGLAPSSVWLTRVSLRLAAGQAGADWPLTFSAGASVSPIVRAGAVRLDACSGDTGASGAGGGTGGSSGVGGPGGLGGGPSSGESSTTGGPSGVDDPDYYDDDEPVADMGCGCAGTADTVVVDDSEPQDEDVYDEEYEDDGCSGDTSEPAPEDEYYAEDDGCSGDTSEPESEDEYYAEDDGCSGDTSEDEYYAEDDGCSGDTSEPESEDEYYAEDDGCSGGSDDSAESEDCSIAGERKPSARKKRGPKLSVMALGVFALIAPLRRASRPRRSSKR